LVADICNPYFYFFLVRAYGWALAVDPVPAGGTYFVDTAGNTHEAAIDVAFELGLPVGTAPTQYAPGEDVRRDQMASFLVRLLDRIT
jgi:hypothetical protein